MFAMMSRMARIKRDSPHGRSFCVACWSISLFTGMVVTLSGLAIAQFASHQGTPAGASTAKLGLAICLFGLLKSLFAATRLRRALRRS